MRRIGGEITNGWWHVAAGNTFGQGQLEFSIDRSKLSGDVALVLHADWQKDTDIAVQLLDSQGRALALDLFGETPHNAKLAQTDTFVIPLNRYPEATSIAVRRLSGDLRILSGALFPVLSEVTSKAENEKALAAQLGLLLSPHHWIFSQTGSEGSGASADSALGTVHMIPALSQSNVVGAAVLSQPNYPQYRPLTEGPLKPPAVAASNTTDFMINGALRIMAIRSNGQVVKALWTSSDGVADELVNHREQVGFMSVPLSSAEKEKFFRSSGYPIVELQFARDALEVLVNSGSSLQSITVPQLDAVYGTELRAGAPAAIENWSSLGRGEGAIKVIGGELGWGTTRTFQQLVLKGGPFRKEMAHSDVVYPEGVEKDVADQANAIGFATLRPRTAKVRALAVAANSGEPAYRTTADDIYSGKYPLQRKFYAYVAAPSLKEGGDFSRELMNLLLSDVGQTLVARGGSLPLMASEVIAERKKLDLP
jgi:phosphate transport system substrate-binding protein